MKHVITPLFLASTMLTLHGAAIAQNQATVVRSTDLKAKPFSDAETLKTLKESERLSVLSRKASWTEVKSLDTSGWVKMLSLRFDDQGTKSFNLTETVISGASLQKGTNSGSTTTTAVKGWDKNDFKNLSPNMEKLQKMQALSVSKPDAKAFASQVNLADQEQAYLKAEGEK